MTIWLDKAYIRNEILQDADWDSIRITSENDNRATVIVDVSGSIELEPTDIGRWKRSLDAIRTGDPELRISSDGSLRVEIEVDKTVFTEDVDFED